MLSQENLDLSEAVNYHYDQFPPQKIDYQKLAIPLSNAVAALARYDQMLKNMHNSEILLAPLRNQEAVVSSRMEGAVSTIDEVLQYEADQEGGSEDSGQYRSEALEVVLYSHAMRKAQHAIAEGQPISSFLIRNMHRTLLGFGRGASLSPGEFKDEQNYLADRNKKKVLFIPITPEQLEPGLEKLIAFTNNDEHQLLIRTALAHLEFEALHPFKDGNGRVGRMLITLMLWHFKAVSAPHFYISGFFERYRDNYIDHMREVSRVGEWTEWVLFFLNAIEEQANRNLETAENIKALYEKLKETFREKLSSQWSVNALDFLFARPIFRNNTFTTQSGIPEATAHRFTRILVEEGILTSIRPAAGRRPAMYSFDPLLELVRS